jgi:O-antigen ligase
MALKWVPLSFEEPNLKKAKKEGFLPEAASVIFPGDKRVPTLPKGYRVMFLAFLLHGLSLPAHEFLRGLLFVYGVQLHQLTLNSILHIAYFITLCESFLGIDPHWVLWKFLFRLCPSVSLDKNPKLGGAVVSV